jgi:hypothetical protein
MIEDAMVDCYNEDEEFTGMLATLEDRMEFPFQAQVLGKAVEVIGLDGQQSSERRGVVAKVRKGGRRYTVALADVEAVQKDSETAEWLEPPPAGWCWPSWLPADDAIIHPHLYGWLSPQP